MSKLLGLLHLNFIPQNTNFALLLLRLWIGLSMLLLHGWTKFTGFSDLSSKFPDPFGIGAQNSLILAVFAEVVCSILLVLGLFTRLAALFGAVTMAVAFFIVHKASLTMGPGSGELAFIYLAGYLTLFFAGAGKYSLDRK
jgi:putative oxidoreductase